MLKKRCFYVKTISIFIFLIICTPIVFAQSARDSIYRQIDGIFRTKNLAELNDVLNANLAQQKEYAEIEKYILKSVRELIVANDLQFASDACLALIDHNLDNFEALELYTTIEKGLEKQRAEQKAEEQRKQIEAFKKQAVTEKTKEDINKEYKTITNALTGETVYLDQDYNMHFGQVSWGAYLGVVDVDVVIDAGNVSPKYGILLLGNGFYRGDNFSIGGEFLTDILLMSFGGYQNIMTTVKASMLYAHNRIHRNLFFRLGYSQLFTIVDYDYGAKTCMPLYYMGPTLGIGFRGLPLRNIVIDGFIDYNFGHLFYKNVKTSFETGFNFLVPIADVNQIDVSLNFCLFDVMSVTAEGVHNQVKLVISIGVGSND